MKIILPIGYHCNISFICKGLGIKKETGLFEYLETRKLQYINEIISILINMYEIGDTNYEKLISGVDKHIYLNNNPYVYSCHYMLEEYKEIFKRRVNRFFNRIINNDELIFCRINIQKTKTTKPEIINFYNLIKKINPNLKITILLIDTINNPKLFIPYYFNKDIYPDLIPVASNAILDNLSKYDSDPVLSFFGNNLHEDPRLNDLGSELLKVFYEAHNYDSMQLHELIDEIIDDYNNWDFERKDFKAFKNMKAFINRNK